MKNNQKLENTDLIEVTDEKDQQNSLERVSRKSKDTDQEIIRDDSLKLKTVKGKKKLIKRGANNISLNSGRYSMVSSQGNLPK